MAKHIQKVLAVGGMNGEVDLLENLFEELGDEPIDAVINTYRPRIVIAGGDEPSGESLGTSLVLCPGRLDRGRYALVDFHNSTLEFGPVAARAAV
ncbi:MAG: hypothetical protein ACXVY6_14280 [Gaiellaceae bacterium]